MTDRISAARVILALCVAMALGACSTAKPLSKSYGVATQANMKAQIVPIDPGTVDHGPTPTDADRARIARDAYKSGNVEWEEPQRSGGGK